MFRKSKARIGDSEERRRLSWAEEPAAAAVQCCVTSGFSARFWGGLEVAMLCFALAPCPGVVKESVARERGMRDGEQRQNQSQGQEEEGDEREEDPEYCRQARGEGLC